MPSSLVKLRRPKESDVTAIEDIADKYNLPLVERFETAAVIEKDNEIIAFGVTRQILEVVLYCDGRDRDKALAMSKLLEQAKLDARAKGFDSLYAFVFNEKVAESIIKHHGFRKTRGVGVILDLE